MTELGSLSRRSLITGTAGLAGAAALAPRGALAQASPPANAQLGTPARLNMTRFRALHGPAITSITFSNGRRPRRASSLTRSHWPIAG